MRAHPLIIGLVLAVLIPGCSPAGIQAPSEGGTHSRLHLPDASGETHPVDVLDNGDGTWSYPLAVEFDDEQRVTKGAVTWRYAGQASFSYQTAEPWGTLIAEYDGVVRDPVDLLMDTRRIDNEGRVWEAESVDLDALRARVRAEDGLASVEAELEPPGDWRGNSADSTDLPYQEGELIEWVPMAWSSPCSSGDHVWDAESRIALTSPLEIRQESAMVVAEWNDDLDLFFQSCSGVRVGVSWVLTNAHCVTNHDPFGPDTPVANNTIRVCTRGNFLTGADCVGVADIIPHPDFNRNWPVTTDFDDDVALIELQTNPTSTFSEMTLANDASLTGFTIHSIAGGSPIPSCAANNYSPIDNSVANGWRQYYQTGVDVTYFSGSSARFKADLSPGASGSPIFHCDGGTCNTTETGRIDALMAGWNSVNDRFVGPRTIAWRTWALGIIDD